VAIDIKRAYDKPSAKDGARVLVDRLWPRGIKKSEACIQAWLRDLAPSDALRRWFHQSESKEFFPEFRKRYLEELSRPAASTALEELYGLARKNRTVTLIYASKNKQQNNATILRDLLNGMRKPPTSSGPERATASGRRSARMPRS
jgi:uncharacterized protein YeaO (DUF488 family)